MHVAHGSPLAPEASPDRHLPYAARKSAEADENSGSARTEDAVTSGCGLGLEDFVELGLVATKQAAAALSEGKAKGASSQGSAGVGPQDGDAFGKKTGDAE